MDRPPGPALRGTLLKAPPHRFAGQTSPVQDRLRTRRSWYWTRRIVARSERGSPIGAAISVSGCRPGPISCMCEWSIFLGVRRLKRRCAGITLLSYASIATRGFGELACNDNRGARLIRPQASSYGTDACVSACQARCQSSSMSAISALCCSRRRYK